MNEIWKDIQGYEGLYQVSNLGRVKALSKIIYSSGIPRSRKEKFMKQDTCEGYKRVGLTSDGVQRKFFVHRLVAIAFIQNPNNLPEVNHIDTNTENNSVTNLEWCTQAENVEHAIANGKGPAAKFGADHFRSKPIKQLTKEGAIVKEFWGVTEAEKEGFSASKITACCKGKRMTHGGYKWQYS